MLPYKKAKGKAAFKNIMCHIGVPEKFKDQKFITIKGADVSKLPNLKYMSINDICKLLGAKL